jgi:hypothetical protein
MTTSFDAPVAEVGSVNIPSSADSAAAEIPWRRG